jgi:hypothetical protein
LNITGSPYFLQKLIASSFDFTGSGILEIFMWSYSWSGTQIKLKLLFVPGMIGTPAAIAANLAAILSPICWTT